MIVTLVFRIVCFFTVTETRSHTESLIVILCPYVSHPQLSQPDCQGTSGPNKVRVCVIVPPARPCVEVLLSLLLPPTALRQHLYFKPEDKFKNRSLYFVS